MKKLLFISMMLFSFLFLRAQTIYRTGTLVPNIKTLQIYLSGQPFSLPVIELNTSGRLSIQFDEMSHEIRSYSYRVFHCNEDWTASVLSSNEYLTGFPTGMITEYSSSTVTSYAYTNYKFTIPNDDMIFTKSGNYVVQIYEDDQQDKPAAQACFYIVEPAAALTANIRGNTDVELNRRMQQLDFDIDLKGYKVNDPKEEIKITIRQNGRIDNEVRGIQPTFLRGDKLSYINNRDLIFEGGNEYHRFDISSVYAGSNQIERIDYDRVHYNAYLYPDKIQPDKIYSAEPDVNGKFIINLQEAHFELDTEADYINVHFSIPKEEPFFDGQVYIGGGYNYNLLNETSHMQYDFNSGRYFKSLLLKQGGYNYQYWFLPKGGQKANVERVDGSFWQTRNEYTIYVYHRPWGGRYDKLIAVKTFEN